MIEWYRKQPGSDLYIGLEEDMGDSCVAIVDLSHPDCVRLPEDAGHAVKRVLGVQALPCLLCRRDLREEHQSRTFILEDDWYVQECKQTSQFIFLHMDKDQK